MHTTRFSRLKGDLRHLNVDFCCSFLSKQIPEIPDFGGSQRVKRGTPKKNLNISPPDLAEFTSCVPAADFKGSLLGEKKSSTEQVVFPNVRGEMLLIL